jgi:CBS domain-containing protein
MKTVRGWLQNQKASDIMTRDVVVLHPSDRLAEAVRLLLHERVSGAPVVDERGVCVGVLSATDVLNYDEARAPATAGGSKPRRRASFDTWDPGSQWWREFGRITEEMQSQLDESVEQFMTRELIAVTEDAPLGVAIRMMLKAHVHRVLVLDEQRRLRGIVTTMDVLSAALRAGSREPLHR